MREEVSEGERLVEQGGGMSTCDGIHSECKRERCGFLKELAPAGVAKQYQDGHKPASDFGKYLYLWQDRHQGKRYRPQYGKRKRKSAASLKVKR